MSSTSSTILAREIARAHAAELTLNRVQNGLQHLAKGRIQYFLGKLQDVFGNTFAQQKHTELQISCVSTLSQYTVNFTRCLLKTFSLHFLTSFEKLLQL
mmetsp:Transcript_10277/g.19351  ORF Transcript_10277/g.19351 Transcript_10277/m.19351 type:complete len:99 (-) Transcript_10277:370-666(-)